MSDKAVCVVGAGSSGMTAVKALQDAGIGFDCFERTGVIGGNWAFGSPASAAYRTLHINSYRKDMAYADYPMPKTMSDFPHHLEIAEYFNAYVDHFGLREKITFDTSVEHAEPLEDGGWRVTLSDGRVRTYDTLVVASGHHSDARWPEPPFPGHFDGLQMHAHDYRDLAQLEGHDVVVVGIGNSAMDIAVESSYVARHTYLSSRRGAYVIPKYILGRPALPIPIWLPWQIRQRLFQWVLRLAVGPVERYGLPRPEHGILQAHPTVSDTILSRLTHGAIVPKPNIAELAGHEVRFVDGSAVEADVVVYCTGYKITFPYFSEQVLAAKDNDLQLYARMFAPDRSDLVFIGFVQPWGSIMPVAEAQSKVLADYLTGRYALPSPPAMARAIAAQKAALARRYVASKRHTIQIDMPVYLRDLARERSAGQRRAAHSSRGLPVPG
ncbi:MAG: putative flavoprotein involved in transport, partial [Acidimicrobiaceae bacterium]|nr:putative flavoprotein involved in transport [Acidimicrobiaceae bacterium]